MNRGRWQIRTAVNGFADHYLTTRSTDPQNIFDNGANVILYFILQQCIYNF